MPDLNLHAGNEFPGVNVGGIDGNLGLGAVLDSHLLGSMKIVAVGEDGSALAGVTMSVKTKDGQAVGEYTVCVSASTAKPSGVLTSVMV